jgi:hypothetical protein
MKWHRKYENEEMDSFTSQKIIMKRKIHNNNLRWEIINGSKKYIVIHFLKAQLTNKVLSWISTPHNTISKYIKQKNYRNSVAVINLQ